MISGTQPKLLKCLLAITLATTICPITPAIASPEDTDAGEKATGRMMVSAIERANDNIVSTREEHDSAGEINSEQADIGTPKNAGSGNDPEYAIDQATAPDSQTEEIYTDTIDFNGKTSLNPIVEWTPSGTCEWMIDAKGCLTIRPQNEANYGLLDNWSVAPWQKECYQIETVYLIGHIIAPTTRDMFNHCIYLREVDLSNLDTSQSTSMYGMFRDCRSLTSLDLSSLDTSNVKTFRFAFDGCSSLATLNLSGINTSQATDMCCMFNCCKSLGTLDVSKFDTSSVTDMDSMFAGCSALKAINLETFDTSNVALAASLFAGCSSLEQIIAPSFVTAETTTIQSMFSGCSSLKLLDVSGFDTSNVYNMASLFAGCSSLSSLDLSHFNTSKTISMNDMFCGCSSLKAVDVSSFDTSSTTNMSFMFEDCKTLAFINLNRFDTTNVQNFSYMFSGCSSLTMLDLTSFSGREATIINGMFRNCSSLKSLDFSSFNTPNLTMMGSLFSGCSSLASIDLSPLETRNVTDMSNIFNDCASLKTIDTSKLDTTSAMQMSGMFDGCVSLKQLDVSHFDTSNVLKMNYMFAGCKSLASLDVSAFITNKTVSMARMFYECETLSTLNLSSFNTASATDLKDMLQGCTSLKSISVGDQFCFTGEGSTSCEFPKPTIEGARGKWVNSTTGVVYDPSGIPNNRSALYLALTDPSFLTTSMFAVDTAPSTYTGAPIEKQVFSEDLKIGKDYDITYSNNSNVGTGVLTLSGKGDYTGTLKYEFKIEKADPNYDIPSNLTATINQTLGELELPSGFSWQDPETTSVGPLGKQIFLATFTPLDTTNYNIVHDIPLSVNVYKISISPQMFLVDTSSAIYSGAPIKRNICSNLINNIDYEIVYFDNTNAGTATIYIIGIGAFEGALSYNFAIEKADPAYEAPGALDARYGQTLADLALPEGFSWQGDPGTPVGDPGEHQLLATFAPADEANYNVVRDIPVTVRVTRPVDASMFSVAQGPFPYSGSAIEPAVRSAVVPEGSYTVEYRDNVCAGQAVAVITGAGGYTGSCELRFAIEKADPAYEAPKKLIGTFGETLSSITLPDGFSWQDDPNTPIDWRGNKEFELSYTPTDTANYNTVRNIPITVFVEYDSVNIPTIAPFAYNGQLHKPTFDDDQRIAVLANNGGTDAGIYTATVALANPAFDRWVDGTVDPKTISYIISPADISSASIENIPDAVLEDGKAEPAVSALFNEKPLQPGKDFTVSYENNTQVGTGDVVISGTGNFTGITRLSFRVGLADISSCKPIIYDTPLVYQGEPVTPHVYLGKPNSGVTLHEGIDYEVTYSDNNAIGKATATLRGIGDYVGSTAIAFEIVNKLDLASMSCQVDNCAFYTGSPITQPVSVYRGRSSLSEGVDYTVTYENNINPGCATAVIHGIGNYTGEARCDFSIIRKADYSLSNDNAKLSLSGDNRYVYSYATNTFLYTGNSVTPQATVYLQVGSASIKLVEGIDYTVSYSNNNAIGTGFVTVTGINGLEGSVFGSFAISKTLPVSALNLSSVWDFDQIDYDLSSESPVKPKLIPSPYFVEGADYDLTYKDCNKIGTGFVSINGRGRYTGSVTLPVSIVAKHSRLLLQDCTVDTIPNQIYTGSPIRPSITMRNANGRILDNGLEYEPRFYNNVNVGTANVTVAQGAGFTTYDGYLQTSFNILPENIANTEIDPIPDQPLQKQAPKPDPRLTFNGKLLRENIDYEATYINNDKLGTATIAITGKGNFTGQTTTTFNVVEYEMPYDDVLTEFESKAVKWNDDEGQILKFSLPKGGAPFFIVNSVQGSYNAKAAILDEQANEIYSFDLQSQKQYGAMALPAGDYYLKIWGDTYNQAGVCVLHYGNGLYGQNDNCIYEKEDNCPSNGQTIADVATPVNLNSRFIGTAYMPPMSVDTDYYSFTLDKPMTIDLNFSANQSFRFDLVDDSGKTIEKADGDGYLSKMTYWDKEATVIMKCGVLKPGTYYVKVNAAMKEAIGSTYYCDIKTIASHWVSSNGRWWWQETDGSYPTSCWLTIDGKCYHFDLSGYMQTGWLKADGSWYWLGNDGAARTGWQQINGTWYWFENDGRMATGWQTIDAKRYLFASSGSMMTGWQQTGGSWYYLGGSGAMATGWKSIGGTWYWFDQNGIMATGWFKPDESYYYANNSGAMQSNCWIGDYYLTSSGMMATNTWIGPYYVGPDGKWMR